MVGRHDCHTCLLLEDYYRLKVSNYLLAAKGAASGLPSSGVVEVDEDLNLSKAFRAGHALLKHWRSCEKCKRPRVA
jgi:hypothetical protein